MRSLVVSLIAALALIYGGAAQAAPIGLDDDEGAVVFSYSHPNFGSWRPLATFSFAPFDPATGQLVAGARAVTHTPQARDWPLTRKALPAGHYVLRDIYLYAGSSSDYCFGDGTLSFEVRPGEVTYLGAFTFEPANAPPGGLANAVLGNNGVWRGRLRAQPGDRAAAQGRLPEVVRGVTAFAPIEPAPAVFAVEGRPREEVGRDCFAARAYGQ